MAKKDTSEPDKPGVLDRLRMRFPWFDHVMRAAQRYQDCKGDFLAAGITYFTVFALFPLMMVGFSVAGFVLVRHQDWLNQIKDWVKGSVKGDSAQTLTTLIDAAVDSRTSVGLIGLAVAAYAGLGWMGNLREALSAMWEQRHEPGGFVRTKLSDLVALVSVFLAIIVTVGLTALTSSGLMEKVLSWFNLEDAPGVTLALKIVTQLLALGISWLLFSWMIARLPRESLSLRSAGKAGLLAAIGFEVFKQVASIYLSRITHGPAGATFGPVLGLLVFAYITARMILFATAWAATSTENLALAPVAAPGPATIEPRDFGDEGARARTAVVAGIIGALAALGLSRLRGRRD